MYVHFFCCRAKAFSDYGELIRNIHILGDYLFDGHIWEQMQLALGKQTAQLVGVVPTNAPGCQSASRV